MVKLSIVIPVLNSHEALRRQFLYFERIGIPDDTEIVIVDDGSEPPLSYRTLRCGSTTPSTDTRRYLSNLTIHATNDKRPWTWALARNAGARLAKGEYLLMFDIDHIITRELIDAVRNFGGQKMQFKREFAVLNENGEFIQDLETLKLYGFTDNRFKDKGFTVPPLPNNFAMRKDVFWEIGGYREDLVERPYPQGEDRLFKKKWYEWERAGKGNVHTERPTIYTFPTGYLFGDVDFNPFGLFHKLSRKTNRNFKYRRGRYGV